MTRSGRTCSWSAGSHPERLRLRLLATYAFTLVALAPIALLTLNAAYGFDDTVPQREQLRPRPAEHLPQAATSRGRSSSPSSAFFADLPLPLPGAFVQLLKFQFGRVSTGNTIYFLGETSKARLARRSCPLQCPGEDPSADPGAPGPQPDRPSMRQRTTAEWLMLITAGFVLALFTYLKSVSIGLRYVLPIYPCLFLLISRLVRDGAPLWQGLAAGRARLVRTAMALLLAGLATGTVWQHPHYLAHFNSLVGGPRQAHKYLADSFLDWGQDLPALKRWMDDQGIDRIRLAYFGSADARHYGIEYTYLPSVGLAPRDGGRWWYETSPEHLPPLKLRGGPIAISASLLAGVFYPGYYAPLRQLEPIAQVGYSILIFDPGP